MQNATVHGILGLLRLIMFPARVKLKYERTYVKNKAFVARKADNKNQCRPIFIGGARDIQLRAVSRFIQIK